VSVLLLMESAATLLSCPKNLCVQEIIVQVSPLEGIPAGLLAVPCFTSMFVQHTKPKRESTGGRLICDIGAIT